jgi:hypothetical protein
MIAILRSHGDCEGILVSLCEHRARKAASEDLELRPSSLSIKRAPDHHNGAEGNL